MKKDDSKLYFIAIVPGEPVYSGVMEVKSEIKDRFNSKAVFAPAAAQSPEGEACPENLC